MKGKQQYLKEVLFKFIYCIFQIEVFSKLNLTESHRSSLESQFKIFFNELITEICNFFSLLHFFS